MGSTPDHSLNIVSGLPRSGTSMMMQMLHAGGLATLTDGVRAADDDNPRGYLEYEPVKRTRQDASWLDGAAGKVVKLVHLLLYDLPTDRSYRVILMRRQIDEVVRSQAIMLARSGRQGANIPHDRLARALERQWTEVATYLQQTSAFEMMEVRYDAVVERPLEQSATISRFLGGQLDTDAMAAAVDRSLYRSRQ